MGQGAGQHLVLLDRNVMFPGGFDDLRADDALTLRHDKRGAGLVVVQRDRKPVFGLDAHSARSRKWPARAAGAACGGAPSRITISPGCNSARLSAWLRSGAPARSCSAVADRSAQIRTEVFSP